MLHYLFGTGLVHTIQQTLASDAMGLISMAVHRLDGIPIILAVLGAIAARGYFTRTKWHLVVDAVVVEGIVLVANFFVNYVVKVLLRQPRPYEEDGSVFMVKGTGYGFPSGAVQTATLLALQYLLFKYGSRVVAVIAVLVSLTRMYLGVHYLHDCIGGAILGVGIFGVLQS